MRPLFEYVVVVKLDEMYQPELILELDWDAFFKHKHWHSRINAYNLILSKSLIFLTDIQVLVREGLLNYSSCFIEQEGEF